MLSEVVGSGLNIGINTELEMSGITGAQRNFPCH